MNNTTESFIYDWQHNVSISEYLNNTNSTTFLPQGEVYLNTISNIHDWDSLILFYNLMFAGHPLVFISCVFGGLYFGCMLIEHKKRSKQVVKK